MMVGRAIQRRNRSPGPGGVIVDEAVRRVTS
jgi:hypothetical protein